MQKNFSFKTAAKMYYDKLSDLGIKLTRRSGQEKTLCPQCSNSRKNKRDRCLSVNINTGEFHCHNCGYKGNVRAFEPRRVDKVYEKPSKEILHEAALKQKTLDWFLNERKISEGTLRRFMIFNREEFMPQENAKMNCICFPYFREQELINVKFRDGKKNFKMSKGAELIFYNINSIIERKKVIITEGEIDCLSAYEVGFSNDGVEPLNEYGVVSVPNGASGSGNANLEYLDNCADYFLGLDEIVIATDGDLSGKGLASELVRRLGVERCRVVEYPKEAVVPTQGGNRLCKDLNEVLVYFGKDKVVECVMSAPAIPVDGIYFVSDVLGSMLENFDRGVQLAPTTNFPQLDNYFRWKKGDINLCTGYANAGKTFFLLQLMLTKSIYDGWKWGVFSPENYPANDFFDDLVEMYVGKWISRMSREEYKAAAEFIGEHIFYVYPDYEHDLVTLHEKFRYLILKKGIDGVLIDPWNQLDHNVGKFQREDMYLSSALKDIKRFALLNHICYNIIAHPKNPTYNEDRSLPPADMYDLHGGAMFGNKVDNLLSYHRPNHHEDKNSPLADIHIQKIKRKRTGGQLGFVSMRLNWEEKRFYELPNEIAPCNPRIAEGGKTLRDLPQGWLPYKDDSGSEIGF